jgi:hypothetical protein
MIAASMAQCKWLVCKIYEELFLWDFAVVSRRKILKVVRYYNPWCSNDKRQLRINAV